jgi:hypothetical protein
VNVLAEQRAHPRGGVTQSDEALIPRAMLAHARAGAARPDRAWLVEYETRRYVTLWTGGELVSCYRVRAHDGVLKLLKRYPDGLYRECAAAIESERQGAAAG